MDFSSIPDVIRNASMDAEHPRSLKTMAELLKISYELLQHPILGNWKYYEAIDPFMDAMENVEYYKIFNRTVIERTISQSSSCQGLLEKSMCVCPGTPACSAGVVLRTKFSYDGHA